MKQTASWLAMCAGVFLMSALILYTAGRVYVSADCATKLGTYATQMGVLAGVPAHEAAPKAYSEAWKRCALGQN